MAVKLFAIFILVSVAGANQFNCPDKTCTEEVFTSLTPCTYTDIDDAGKCLCSNNCPVLHRDRGTCNEIKCDYFGTPRWLFWIYMILSTFSGSLVSYAFSKRHVIKEKCLDGLQRCRQWSARQSRRRNANPEEVPLRGYGDDIQGHER